MGPNGPAMLSAYEDLNSLSIKMKSSLKSLTQPTVERDCYLRDDVQV